MTLKVVASTAYKRDLRKVRKQGKNLDELFKIIKLLVCLLYTSPSPRDLSTSRMPSSA